MLRHELLPKFRLSRRLAVPAVISFLPCCVCELFSEEWGYFNVLVEKMLDRSRWLKLDR